MISDFKNFRSLNLGLSYINNPERTISNSCIKAFFDDLLTFYELNISF